MLMDNISRITLVNSQANWKISSISSHAIRFPISLRRTLVNSILSKHHGITSFILYAGSNTVSGRRNPLATFQLVGTRCNRQLHGNQARDKDSSQAPR
jgi:hypothetical protein